MTTSLVAARSRESIERLAGSRLDPRSFRQETVAQLRRAIGFDSWCWSSTDPITALPVKGLADNPPLVGAQRQLFELEFAGPDVNNYLTLVRAGRPVGGLASATGGSLERSRRWATVLGPRGIGDELRCTFLLRGECWGHLALYRSAGGPPFTRADAAFLLPLLRLWAQRHRGEVLAGLAADAVAHPQFRSGILVLDADAHVVAATSDAPVLLGRLPQRPEGLLPLPVTVLLSWLAAHPDRSSAPPLPVRDTAGRWLVVQAERLIGAVTPDTTAVSITTASPSQLAPLTMAAAGLTAREREVTTLVLAGRSTGRIAAELFLTPYTVQDHLKRVFDKLGVHERRQLVARLLHDDDP